MIEHMKNLICTCECGHRFYVSDTAWGMESVCGKCGRPIRVTTDNTRPIDAGIPSDDTSKKGSAGHCARCGRPFRGDWDRNPAAEGVICHICANQGVGASNAEPAPAAIDGARSAAAPDTAEHAPDAVGAGVIDHDADAVDDEEPGLGKRFEDFRETPAFRRGLWAAAISVMVLAVVATFIDSPPPPGETAVEAGSESAGGLGMFGPPEAWSESEKTIVRMVMIALETVFLFVPTFAALFLALAFANRLPAYHWFASAIHVGVVSLGLTAVLFVVSQAIGFFLGFLGVLLAYLLAVFFIWVVYDPGLSAVVTFVGLRAVFGFVAGLVRLLAYGALGLLLLD